jgi:hypothetical protein
MKRQMLLVVLVPGLLLLAAGCKSTLYSSTQSTTMTRWGSYSAVQGDFNKIRPRHTTVEGLKSLGFHPDVTPNVKILTYVDVIGTFMPNPGIRVRDLPDGVRECIEAREKGMAYLVDLHDIHDKRHGNLLLDIFGFKRKTHESGWRFKGMILMKEGLVVYTLSSGEPQISQEDTKVKPLGPFQELDSSISPSIGLLK